MKRIRLNHIFSVICITGWLLLSVACTKDDNEESLPKKLFRPVSFTAIVNANNVELTWTPIQGASYLIELYRDSLKFETDLKTFTFENTNQAKIEDLWGSTRYSARIKAVSTNPATQDSEFKVMTFATGSENIFAELKSDDIEISQITLKWDNTKAVDRIRVTSAGLTDVEIDLTSEDTANGVKTITELSPDTQYTFLLYLGERRRGTVTAKTKPVI
ncbi:hypothetical protein AGMMS50239_21050 [Bacteroidia bacterium]|nr:hypothetical protein AGMMS50239_21050 [Bacteroidia bacterium]